MGINMFALLTLIVVLMLAISVIQDLKRRRQEWTLNNTIERAYDLQIKDHNKANWHKGFQMALGTVLFFLVMEWGLQSGWFDGGGIIEPDAPSNPNG